MITADEQGIVRKPPVPGRKFIAVDLDGTLAHYDKRDKNTGRMSIGPPIPMMVDRVKTWLSRGDVVIIFTSRVADTTKPDFNDVVSMIHAWCEEHIGERLWVTAVKWAYLSEIWDHKARRVTVNLGIPGEFAKLSTPLVAERPAYTLDD